VAGGNTLDSFFSPLANSLPEGTQLSKWTGSSYNTYTYDMIGWLDAGLNYVGSSVTLPPGIGAVLHAPALPPTTLWIGEVMGGGTGRIPATPPASPGIYLLASTWPVASSSFADVVGRAPIDGEAVLTINSLGSPTVVQFDSGGWVDSGFNPVADPVVGLAESAFFALGGADFANWALPVPEPGTFSLLAVGAVIFFRRRK
jgi:PEP-CTERM motif